MPANFHKIPEIQKVLNELEKDIVVLKRNHKIEYAYGIEDTIRKIREIIDSA